MVSRIEHVVKTWIGIICLPLLFAACGSNENPYGAGIEVAPPTGTSSGSASGGTSSGSLVRPNVQVHFPPPVSTKEGANITVRGIVEDISRVSQVRVNGMPAQTDDDYATWRFEEELVPGQNDINVTYLDSDSVSQAAATLRVTRDIALIAPRQLAFDTTNNLAHVYETSRDAVISVDPSTGEKNQISPASGVDSNLLDNPRSLTFDANRNMLLAEQHINPLSVTDTEPGPAPWVRVNTTDGTQSTFEVGVLEDILLVSEENDYNVLFPFDAAVSVAIAGNTAFVGATEGIFAARDGLTRQVPPSSPDDLDLNETIFDTSSVIYTIDLTNGNRESLITYDNIRLAEDATRLFLPRILALTTNKSGTEVYAIIGAQTDLDPPIEPRVVLFKNAGDGSYTSETIYTAAGLTTNDLTANTYLINAPNQLRYDENGNALWVLDSNQIVRIDLSDNTAEVVASLNLRSDSDLLPIALTGMALNADGSQIFAASDFYDNVLAYSTAVSPLESTPSLNALGEPTLVSSTPGNTAPTSASINRALSDVVLIENTDSIYISDKTISTLFEYDWESGEKSTFANINTPNTDVPLLFPLAITHDPAMGALLVLDNANQFPGASSTSAAPRLLSVDLDTGEKTTLFSFNSFVTLNDLTLNSANRLLYTAESSYVRRVDLNADTPTSTLFSAFNIPDRRVLFNTTRAVALDAPNERLLVVDPVADTVFAVQLSDGTRSVLSNATQPENESVDLRFPKDIVVDGANNRALVIDSTRDGIVGVDLDTGERTLVWQNSENSVLGDSVINPEALAFHSLYNIALVIDDVKDTLMALDLETGDAVTLSR